MKLVENVREVATKSLSMWCWYIGSLAVVVSVTANELHKYLTTVAPGLLPADLVQTIDGWALTVAFVAGMLAGPLRLVWQPSLSPKAPE